MNVTLCDNEYDENIPSYDFKNKDQAKDYIYGWLDNKDFNSSVFVCFSNFIDLPMTELRDEQNSILVSHSWDDITNTVDRYINLKNHDKIYFSIFEFESYQEAFKYCIDLKESF